MFLKLLKMVSCTLKLAHPTMQVLKSGKTSPMMLSLIFGLWDALFMK